MNLLLRVSIFLFAFLGVFIHSSEPVSAQASNFCTYSVQTSTGNARLAQGEGSATVRIGITPEQAALGACNGRTTQCVRIQYCDESAWTVGSWCHNNANFQEQNQRIEEVNGQFYIVATSQDNLMYSRRWWLEVSDANDNIPWTGLAGSWGVGEENNVCPGDYRSGRGPRVDIAKGVCQAGWANVVPNSGNPDRLVVGETAQIQVFTARTSGFSAFAFFRSAVSAVDGTNYVSLGNFIGSVHPQGHINPIIGSNTTLGPFQTPGLYRFMIIDDNFVGKEVYCEHIFRVCDPNNASCTLDQQSGRGTIDGGQESLEKFALCEAILDPQEKTACEQCVGTEPGKVAGVYTAVGCIQTEEKGFIRQMIQLLLSVSGLIALLSILAGAFMLSTSQGDSNQVKKAKELITAAVSGLLFIIFSTIILDFIGVQILRIPGLS